MFLLSLPLFNQKNICYIIINSNENIRLFKKGVSLPSRPLCAMSSSSRFILFFDAQNPIIRRTSLFIIFQASSVAQAIWALFSSYKISCFTIIT